MSYHEILGVGFGPSNLALATAIEEDLGPGFNQQRQALFLEARPEFMWHPGMLLPGARIQLSFLKDLVTLRNPQSRFTFLNYLLQKGRLDEFANLRNFFPCRREFNDYYRWVATQLADFVRYGIRVVAVHPAGAGQGAPVEMLEVEARDLNTGQELVFETRNLVLATGGIPYVPPSLDLQGLTRAFHCQHFLDRLPQSYPDPLAPYRFVVVGSGQSAAEIFFYLLSTYPNAQVTAALRRFAYKPADDSHFVNEIFFPGMVDVLYEMPEARRRKLLREHMDTNYSAVDLDLIEAIYEELYERRVVGDTKARVLPFYELRGLEEVDERVRAQFWDLKEGRPQALEADGVILATGFVRPGRHPLLQELEPYLKGQGSAYEVDRNFRVRSQPDFYPKIFLQGYCEQTHGLSDTLLSTLPFRSKEILDEILVEEMAEAV